MTDTDTILEARRLADEGYGSEDIVVRLNRRISHQTAKQICIEQWHRNQRKRKDDTRSA